MFSVLKLEKESDTKDNIIGVFFISVFPFFFFLMLCS